MDGESKFWLATLGFIIGGTLGLSAVVSSCVRAAEAIDAAAPVVESCIKHPATRQPFLDSCL
jgi:hypothetical protein